MQEDGSKKNTIDLTRYARVLIVFAIILLACGFFVDIIDEKQTLDPIKAIKNDTKTGESITTIDIIHWSDDINEVDLEGNPVKPTLPTGTGAEGNTTPSSGSTVLGGGSHSSAGSGIAVIGGGSGSSPGTGTGTGSNPGNDSGSGSNTGTGNDSGSGSGGNQNPGGGSNNETPSTPTVNIDEVNNQLRNSIQSTYGITIKYGSETNGYAVGGMTTNPITDPYVVNQNLNKLNTAMGLYPNGFFREIKNGGIPLTVYLIDSYSIYGVTGVTDSNYSFANISVAVAHPFEETFYHESYHYIERYMFKQGINFYGWNSYNPQDFTYNSINRALSYSHTYAEDAYFVNDYAQTSAEEDRASTFEYMMATSKASCLNKNQPVWRKATAMSNSIDAAINVVSPSTVEYWERHL